ncbi:MAG: hypothetical protein M1377_04435 [Deltaproteobacteria bacterium]|nr:hypothetical protein [Deltaproteobacteria bacterium]
MEQHDKRRINSIIAVGTGLILIASILRWMSYVNIPLWLDEAWRANYILGASRLQDLFVPAPVATLPGYVAWVRFFSFFHVNEVTLRLSSLLPGALVPISLFGASFLVTRNFIVSTAAGFLGVFNSLLVAYSHELKPYSPEAFLHSCYWVVLFYWLQNEEHVGKFCLFFTFVVAMLLMTPTTVFLLPSALIAILLAARKEHAYGRARFLAAFCTISLLTVLVNFLFLAHSAGNSGLYDYWGDNFFGGEGVSRPVWTFKMLSAQFAQAYETPANFWINNWLPWINIIAVLSYPVLIFFGFLQNKTRAEIFYLCSPVLVLIAANTLHLWPLGAIRANIFMIPHFILILVLCINELFSSVPRFRDTLGVLVCVLLISNIHPFSMRAYTRMNPPMEDIPTAMAMASQGMTSFPVLQEYPLLVNGLGSDALLFYTTYRERRAEWFHPVLLQKQTISIADAYRNPSEARKQIGSALEGKNGAHFFASHLNEEEMAKLEASIRDAGWVVDIKQSAQGAAWLLLKPKTKQRGF